MVYIDRIYERRTCIYIFIHTPVQTCTQWCQSMFNIGVGNHMNFPGLTPLPTHVHAYTCTYMSIPPYTCLHCLVATSLITTHCTVSCNIVMHVVYIYIQYMKFAVLTSTPYKYNTNDFFCTKDSYRI